MCWQCDNPDGSLEDYFDILRATMRDSGWAIQGVEDPRLPYSYTIGLHQWGLPELVVTGEQPSRTAELLNNVARDAICGVPLTPGTQFRVKSGLLIEVVDVDHPEAHLNYAFGVQGPGVRALQLVWADSHGRWPWSASFRPGKRRQPVLGVRARAA